MSHTERDAIVEFSKHYRFEPDYRELVTVFLGVEVFAVWYFDKDDKAWETAYVLFPPKGDAKVFGDSKELFADLQRRLPASNSSVNNIVASLCFLAVVATLSFVVIYRTLHGLSSTDAIIIAFLSLAASGSGLFFGRWILFNTRASAR